MKLVPTVTVPPRTPALSATESQVPDINTVTGVALGRARGGHCGEGENPKQMASATHGTLPGIAPRILNRGGGRWGKSRLSEADRHRAERCQGRECPEEERETARGAEAAPAAQVALQQVGRAERQQRQGRERRPAPAADGREQGAGADRGEAAERDHGHWPEPRVTPEGGEPLVDAARFARLLAGPRIGHPRRLASGLDAATGSEQGSRRMRAAWTLPLSPASGSLAPQQLKMKVSFRYDRPSHQG